MKRGTNGNDRSGASKAHRKLRSVSKEAERLGVSKGWLYTEIREGRFPHVKLGSRVLLDPEEVDAKFLYCSRYVLPPDHIQEAIDQFRDLENIADITGLASVLGA